MRLKFESSYRILLCACQLLFTQLLLAQWGGYEAGIYSGIHSLSFQPADIATTPYKVDGNLLSLNLIYFGREFETEPNSNTFQTGGIFNNLSRILNIDPAQTAVFATSIFPALVYSINDNMSAAFSMNMRGYAISNISSSVIKKILQNDLKDLDGQEYNNEFIRTYIHAWIDYKLSFASVVMNRGSHLLKVGASGKFLQGIASARIEIDDFSFKVNDDLLEEADINITIIYNDNVDKITSGDDITMSGRLGGAVDIGVSYEYRPESYRLNSTMGYKMKAGFSLQDMGAIRYKASNSSTQFKVGVENLSLDFLEEIQSMDELMDSLKDIFDYEEKTFDKYSIKTPITMVLHFDYNLGKNFYINVSSIGRFLTMSTGAGRVLKNNYMLRATPRYEDKRFGVYMPFTYDNFLKFNIGITLRWKAFILGSQNIFTTWFYPKEEQVFNLFLAIKVPILKKEFRDIGRKRREKEGKKNEDS